MRRLAALALGAALAITQANAQSAPEAKPLTYEQVKQVAEGLAQLDGYDRVAKDGAREFIVKEFYKFKKGLRAVIADNITKARGALKELNEKNNELVRQYAEGGDKVPDKNMAEFAAAQRKLLDAPSSVSMTSIKTDELDLDQNPVPSSVLSLINPIRDR